MNEIWVVYGAYYDDNGNECHDNFDYYTNRDAATTEAERLEDVYICGTYSWFDVKQIMVKD